MDRAFVLGCLTLLLASLLILVWRRDRVCAEEARIVRESAERELSEVVVAAAAAVP